MAKLKTSTKRKKFSDNIPELYLKKGAKIIRHDPFKNLLNEEFIAQAFWHCLKENDPDGAMEVLSAHIYALSKVQIAKNEDFPCGTLNYSLKSRNPTIRTVAKLVHCTA